MGKADGYLYIQWSLDEKRRGELEIVEKERGRELLLCSKRFSQTETSGVAALVPKVAPPSGERKFPTSPDVTWRVGK
jgi:hypothetical protein